MEENFTQENSTAPESAERSDRPERLAVGVQFRPAGKIYTFVTEDESLEKGDRVIVESEGGTSVGEVALAPHEPGKGQLPANVRKLIRRAGDEDIVEYERCKEKAIECFEAAAERIRSRQLPMKLIDVDISEGGKKAIFVFFAESRVDFRALVKDLAGLLRMRIEMRQVGSRDEAKIAGCMGPCGMTTCCSTHLRQFQSISISMAKHQGLAPNPAKLTGMCGKLKCCLAYEQAAYDECRKGLLKTGSPVETSEGAGKIIGHNVLKRECIVRLYGGGEIRTACDNCRKLTPEERDEAVSQARKAREESEERGARRGRRDAGRRDGKKMREKRDGKEGK
jgi:cell fate regulator YaaT (PSP1 superfamily)